MAFLDHLEKKFGKFTFPYLLLVFLTGQVAVYFAITANAIPYKDLVLNSMMIGRGEFWRVFTYLFIPETLNPLFFVLFVYVFYLTGSKLQGEWGEFRYSIYFGLNWLLTVLFSFLVPLSVFSNVYMLAGFTLAFGTVFPNYEFRLYFLLPVKSKYFAYLSAGYLFLECLNGFGSAMGVAGALIPYGLFFGKDLAALLKQKKRGAEFKREARVLDGIPFHVCSMCNRTDKSDPDLTFRYEGKTCICQTCLDKRNES